MQDKELESLTAEDITGKSIEEVSKGLCTITSNVKDNVKYSDNGDIASFQFIFTKAY
jgi:hypothetical protein